MKKITSRHEVSIGDKLRWRYNGNYIYGVVKGPAEHICYDIWKFPCEIIGDSEIRSFPTHTWHLDVEDTDYSGAYRLNEFPEYIIERYNWYTGSEEDRKKWQKVYGDKREEDNRRATAYWNEVRHGHLYGKNLELEAMIEKINRIEREFRESKIGKNWADDTPEEDIWWQFTRYELAYWLKEKNLSIEELDMLEDHLEDHASACITIYKYRKQTGKLRN